MCNRIFRIELNDCSSPAFVSCGKYYFGTPTDFNDFITSLETRDSTKDDYHELISSFHKYEAGEENITHSVAFQTVQFLTPAEVLHTAPFSKSDYGWVHINVWDSPYKMRCKQVEASVYWLLCEGKYYRGFTAKFTDLQTEGVFEDTWVLLPMGDFWGHPEVLVGAQGQLSNRLIVMERHFENEAEVLEDYSAFLSNPTINFSSFCDEIFGDG